MNPSTTAARVLVQALARLGVRHVVLAPGSRSAPLAYAVAEAASGADRDPAAPELDLHVRVDERVAGFTALGLARAGLLDANPAPVAVITTSGTAVANLLPAVLEAAHSGIPMLLLTADRPHELRGTGANQTTDQVGIFAPAVRETIDVPAPTGRPGEARETRALAARAVSRAVGARDGRPGPVHVNLAYREPLVPDGPWPAPSDDGLAQVVPRVTAAVVGELAMGEGEVPTVVVAGDAAGPIAGAVALANDWPLLAEPSARCGGGPNLIPGYRLLLEEPDLGGQIKRVVVFGRPTLSRQVTALMSRDDVEVWLVAPDGGPWSDPAGRAAIVFAQTPPELLTERRGRASAWLARWQRAGRAALEGAVGALGTDQVICGPFVAAVLAERLKPTDVLVVGASNAIRDLDLVAGWDEPPTVVANRGLAGIDGTISTASGLALGLGRPVRAYLGDVTFLHDAGGLLVGPMERRPDLQVIVVNDGGGTIFDTLEHGAPELAPLADRVMLTPHGVDLGALCAAYGVAHSRVDVQGLAKALGAPVTGTSVVELDVNCPGRRITGARLATAVHDAVRASLDDNG